MFNLFGKIKKPEITDEQRSYFENQFHWLLENFGEELLHKKTLIPDKSDFPVIYNGTEEPVWKTLEIVCKQLNINYDDIHLDFYSDGARQLNAGQKTFYLQASRSAKFAGGLYWGKAQDGKFHVWVNKSLLKNPEGIVAILAHELAHACLLGGYKLNSKYDHDHELITEMFCVFSGFGIFNANKAFQINKGFDGWSYQWAGYLKQQSWGYLLALYSFIRKEEKPDWLKFLSPSLKNDFTTSMKWLIGTEAGENFLASKWKNSNHANPMENINLTGQWIKQSVYGTSYGPELAGKSMLTEIEINDDSGRLSGTANDIDGVDIQKTKTTIEGTIRNNAIEFSLIYHFPDKISEDGVILKRSESPSYAVSYNGYYSPFLQALIGEWEIRKDDPERGKYIAGRGTFEMKRKNS